MKKRLLVLLLAAALLAALLSVSAFAGDDEEDYDCHGYTYCPQFTLFYDDALPYGHWAHASVDWAIIHKITNGVDLTHFGPEAPCTRAQVVTFLYAATEKNN